MNDNASSLALTSRPIRRSSRDGPPERQVPTDVVPHDPKVPSLPRISPAGVYSARSGADSGRKLIYDWLPVLRRSPLWAAVKTVARAACHQSIMWKTGTRIYVLPRTRASTSQGRSILGSSTGPS
jgi:hypothetical protein